MIDFSTYKFHCSSLGNLMTNMPGKKDTKTVDELSQTAKDELIKVYIKEVYGREKEVSSKYIEKGLSVEEDSITLLSRFKQKFLVKNTNRIENDFITGLVDIESPLMDAKSCWDIHTFYAHKTKPLKKDYEWQMQGYTELYKEDSGTVCFCLIDTPLGMIEDEKRKMFYRMNVATMDNPEYMEACEALEKEMMFSDIPMSERIFEVRVKHSPELIQMAYSRIGLCREWLKEFVKNPELIPA